MPGACVGAPVDRIEWVLEQYRTRYWDFTAKHFHEHMVRNHGFEYGYTWTKARLQKAGLVKRARRRDAERRPRRPGMMLFQDGSPFRWLAALDRDLDLIIANHLAWAKMDDANAEVYSAFLVEEEGTMSSFEGVHETIAEPGARQIQDANPGHDTPDTGDQSGAADRRTDAIPDRMARLLRLLPDPACAHEPGSVDLPKTTRVSLAAMAERAQPLQGTAPQRRTEVQCCARRRFADGVLANVRSPGGPNGIAQPRLRLPQSPPTPCLGSSLTRSNRRGT